MQVARPMTGVYKGARYGHKLRLEQCPLLFRYCLGCGTVAKRTFRFVDYEIIGRAGLACPVEVADWNGLAPGARHPTVLLTPVMSELGSAKWRKDQS